MATIQEKQQARMRIFADANKDDPTVQKEVQRLNNARSLSDVADLFMSGSNTNTLISNTLLMIAKQFVFNEGIKELYGNLFVHGGYIEAGAGFNYTRSVPNLIGETPMMNYQTSTDAQGAIAFGSSFTNGNYISFNVSLQPGQPIATNYNTFKTLNVSVPKTFASFSALSDVNRGELLEMYPTQLRNQAQLVYYDWGNKLFTYWIAQGYFSNIIDATAANFELITSSGYTNPKGMSAPKNWNDVLQYYVLPLAEAMQQFRQGFCASTAYVSGVGLETTDFTGGKCNPSCVEQILNPNQYLGNGASWTYSNVTLPPYYNGPSYPTIPTQAKLEDLMVLMTPKVSASQLMNFASNLIGNNNAINYEFSGNRLVKLCGMDVKVVGNNVPLCQQQPAGTPNTLPGNGYTPVMDDNTLIICHKDILKYYEFYDADYSTEFLPNAQIFAVRKQMAFLPFFDPYLPGIILKFDEGVLTSPATLRVNTTN